MHARTISIVLISLCAFPHNGFAQIRNAGDTDPAGRVLAKVLAGIAEPAGPNRAISSLPVLVTAQNGDTVTIRTDDAGVAIAWLKPGTYHFVSLEPVTWEGSTYSWDTYVRIEPGTPVIRFSQLTASTVVAAPAPVIQLAPGIIGVPARPEARIRVFADCQTEGCDLDFIKTQIPIVDYVRDRTDATVHVLVTSQPNGGGGTTFTLAFLGQNSFRGVGDTLTYLAPPSSTTGEKRDGIARTMMLGLVRYLVRTPLADELTVRLEPRAVVVASTVSPISPDPWNLWVFSINVSGNISGEKSQRFMELQTSTSASRVSEDWKIRFGAYQSYDESRYTLSGGNKFRSYRRTLGATQLLARSVGAHFSIGEYFAAGSSTFYNQKLYVRAGPMIEYDVFPYSEATRRQVTLRYGVGVASFHYEDTTIYGKIAETRPNTTLTAALSVKQPWGSISSSFVGNAYLDDFQRRSLKGETVFDFRIFKGFSVDFYGGFSVIRDQLYLPRGELSDEDILVRRRQLASDYTFYGGVGFSYTFGSILNNIVNPRFETPSPF
jgi:hypothetical protein